MDNMDFRSKIFHLKLKIHLINLSFSSIIKVVTNLEIIRAMNTLDFDGKYKVVTNFSIQICQQINLFHVLILICYDSL